MAFVKLDCGMLDSSIWCDKDCRDMFITSLLMAEPFELRKPEKELNTHNLECTGWKVPSGWYGLVSAAGSGIVRRCGLEMQPGVSALKRLASPDPDSRSDDFEGRRMVRIDGGFLILNYDKYRLKDYTAAERMRRYRERKKGKQPVNNVTSNGASLLRNITQAEAEGEAEVQRRGKEPPNNSSKKILNAQDQHSAVQRQLDRLKSKHEGGSATDADYAKMKLLKAKKIELDELIMNVPI